MYKISWHLLNICNIFVKCSLTEIKCLLHVICKALALVVGIIEMGSYRKLNKCNDWSAGDQNWPVLGLIDHDHLRQPSLGWSLRCSAAQNHQYGLSLAMFQSPDVNSTGVKLEQDSFNKQKGCSALCPKLHFVHMLSRTDTHNMFSMWKLFTVETGSV